MKNLDCKGVPRLCLHSKQKLPLISQLNSVPVTSNTFKICLLNKKSPSVTILIIYRPYQACPKCHSCRPSYCRWCNGTTSKWWNSTMCMIKMPQVVLKVSMGNFSRNRASICWIIACTITILVLLIVAKLKMEHRLCLHRSVLTDSCGATNRVYKMLRPSSNISTTCIIASRGALSHQSNSRSTFIATTIAYWKQVSQDLLATTCRANRGSRILSTKTIKKCQSSH